MRILLPIAGAAAALALLSAGAALAAPSITPPDGARFAPGQLFDVRVIGSGLTSVQIDGATVPATSSDANTYNYRAFSFAGTGTHTITATDSTTGNTPVSRTITVLPVSGNRRPSKNIIIFLGDGMGIQHRTAARIVKFGLTNGRHNGSLAMDTMPGVGLVSTASLNSIVTDSAPGMANYVTGNKAQNNQEGVFPDNTAEAFDNPRVEYLSEYLHRTKGTSLGIVSTADIEDATPAANAAHTSARGNGTGICDEYLDESGRTGLAVLLGGGRRWFIPANDTTQTGFSSRTTGTGHGQLPADLVTAYGIPASFAALTDVNRNLLADFQTAGFTYVADRTALLAQAANSTKLLGLFGYGNMNVAYDKINKKRGLLPPGHTTFVTDDYGAPDQPMLDEMTQAAITVLSKNTNGFVLMVEGAHIDKQSHLMDADRAMFEVIEFDNAIAKALAFAKSAGDTTVIVTADHECGGFSIIGALNTPQSVTATSSTGVTAGSVATLKALPDDSGNNNRPPYSASNPSPARQRVVGTYDAAGFPKYTLFNGFGASNASFNGFPDTNKPGDGTASDDTDGKVLIGFGANGDRYEGWLAKPLPVIDSLLPTGTRNILTAANYPVEPYNRLTTDPRFIIDPSTTPPTTAGTGDNGGFFVRGQVPGTQAVHTGTDIPLSAFSTGNSSYTQFVGSYDNTDVFFGLMRSALGGY